MDRDDESTVTFWPAVGLTLIAAVIVNAAGVPGAAHLLLTVLVFAIVRHLRASWRVGGLVAAENRAGDDLRSLPHDDLRQRHPPVRDGLRDRR